MSLTSDRSLQRRPPGSDSLDGVQGYGGFVPTASSDDEGRGDQECTVRRIPRPVLLLVLCGGGFTFETRCLLKSVGMDFDIVYLKTEFGGSPGDTDLPAGEWHAVPAFGFSNRRSLRQSIRAFIKTFITTLGVIRRRRIDFVLCVGCSHAVPMLLAGRIFKKKAIFIESITRANRLSVTGLLVYHLRLATTFIVQWPALQQSYPSTTLGTVL